MFVSKLSLSKNKAVKKRTDDVSASSIKHLGSLPGNDTVSSPTADVAKAGKAPASNVRKNASGQKGRHRKTKAVSNSSLLLRLLVDDSDWDSDSDPSTHDKGDPSTGTGSTNLLACKSHGITVAETEPAVPRSSPLAQLPSEIYDLDRLSEDEIDGQKPEGGVACCKPPTSSGPVQRQQHVPLRPAVAESPTSPGRQHSIMKLVHYQQPQHRKRSFEQEVVTESPPPQTMAVSSPQELPPTASALVPASMCLSAAEPTGWVDLEAETGRDGQRLRTRPDFDSASQNIDICEASLQKYEEVKAWLQGLQLEQYYEDFVREEIDLTIIHALTIEDLSSIGITHRSHQQSIITAGRKLGPAARHAQRKRSCLGAVVAAVSLQGSVTARPVARTIQFQAPAAQPSLDSLIADKQQQDLEREPQQQQEGVPLPQRGRQGRGLHQSLLQVWKANSVAQAETRSCAVGARDSETFLGGNQGLSLQQQEGETQRDADVAGGGTRSKERDLFARLYPAPGFAALNTAQHMPADGSEAKRLPPLSTLLHCSAASSAARVADAASLWLAARECRHVVPGMEERLNKRREKAGLDGAATEKLARGGTAYPQMDETRALKIVKLEALRQELAMHEETMVDLKRLIQGMEQELGLA